MARFIYGINPVLEALRAHGKEVQRVLVERGPKGRSTGGDKVALAAKEAGVRVEEVPPGDLQRRSQGGVHQGVGCELAEFAYVEVADLLEAAEEDGRPAFLLVLDGVTDPQNLGAILRTAELAGVTGAIVPRHRAVHVTPAAAKAAAGADELKATFTFYICHADLCERQQKTLAFPVSVE